MRNPFRTEEAAFRFLMLTIGYFGLIVIASVINKWVGPRRVPAPDGRRRHLVVLRPQRSRASR